MECDSVASCDTLSLSGRTMPLSFGGYDAEGYGGDPDWNGWNVALRRRFRGVVIVLAPGYAAMDTGRDEGNCDVAPVE